MLIREIGVATASAGLLLTLLTATPPGGSCRGVGCEPEPDPGGGSQADASGGTLSVTVWGSGTTNGDTGSFEVPLETVWIHPTCWYFEGPTGEEYAEYVESGQINWDRQHMAEDIPELPDWEQYADDTEGHWWYRVCSSAHYDGELSDFFDYASNWFDENPPIYVEPGDPEPQIAVPPEVLMEVAYDALEVPPPTLAWNPTRVGDAATFVNLDTWVWLDDSPISLEVHAAAGGNEATVVAALDSMTVSAPSAAAVTCDGAGVPWSPGAAAGCEIVFTRSSANQPGNVTPVTVETTWTVEWSANGSPQGALDPQTITNVTDVPVAEVQTVVTG